MPVWVKIVDLTLQNIKNGRTGSDVGNELEIWGRLGGQVAFFNNQGKEETWQNTYVDLWSVPSSNPKVIYQGTLLPVNKTQRFLVWPNTHVGFGGIMFEDDSPLGSDFMGVRTLRFYYRDLNPNFYPYHWLTFQEEEQLIYVFFKVEFKGMMPFPPV